MALSERLFAAGLEQLSGSVVQIRADAKGRLDHLEQRLASNEKATRFNSDALDHALEKIEAGANQRAVVNVENEQRSAHSEQQFNRLHDSIARLEAGRLDADDARRLEAIERTLGDMADRLKGSDPALGASLQTLSQRLQSLEQNQKTLMDELRARLVAPHPPMALEPPFAAQVPPLVAPSESSAKPVAYGTAAVPDFKDIFPQPAAVPDNFLTQARRSVRTAPEKPRQRYFLPALVALLAVLALATGLALSARLKTKLVTGSAVGPQIRTVSLPEPPDSDLGQFVVVPQSGDKAGIEKSGNAAPLDRLIRMANSGDPVALTVLGLSAADGQPGNLPDAVKFLTQAAEKGQPVAQYRLGTLYERGLGVAADPAKATHWYEMAANQGNRKSMHNLAIFYAGGAAGKKSMTQAARWFAKAAALGLSDSQFNLAVLYERGEGVPQSLVDAFKWYGIAAASGDAESRARIAVLQTQLGEADKAAAGRAVAAFHAGPLDHAANVPPDGKGI